MNINNAIEVLKKNILDQATYFLEEADEFFPFGATIDKNDNLKPVGISLEEDDPNAIEVLKKLETALTERIDKYECQYAAIGLDVYINTNTSKGIAKKTGLEIRFYSKDSKSIYYFLYFKKEGKYFFEENSDIILDRR